MKKKGIAIFKDAVAIVTGGASGIGRALTKELVSYGAIVIVADLQEEVAQEFVDTITASGGEAYASALDVTNFEAFDQLVKEVMEKHKRLDYLFNNAGIMFMGDTDKYSISDWNFTIDVNLRGIVNGVQASYNRMIKQGFGHIINTASMAGLIPTAGSIGYTTTKHAVVGLSQALKVEAEAHNIRVSTFCPGVVRTPIMQGGKFGRNLQNLNEKQQKSFLNSLEKIKPMDPALFAKEALYRVARNKFLIILPRWNCLFWLLHRLSSSFGLTFAKFGYRQLKESIR